MSQGRQGLRRSTSRGGKWCEALLVLAAGKIDDLVCDTGEARFEHRAGVPPDIFGGDDEEFALRRKEFGNALHDTALDHGGIRPLRRVDLVRGHTPFLPRALERLRSRR